MKAPATRRTSVSTGRVRLRECVTRFSHRYRVRYRIFTSLPDFPRVTDSLCIWLENSLPMFSHRYQFLKASPDPLPVSRIRLDGRCHVSKSYWFTSPKTLTLGLTWPPRGIHFWSLCHHFWSQSSLLVTTSDFFFMFPPPPRNERYLAAARVARGGVLCAPGGWVRLV